MASSMQIHYDRLLLKEHLPRTQGSQSLESNGS